MEKHFWAQRCRLLFFVIYVCADLFFNHLNMQANSKAKQAKGKAGSFKAITKNDSTNSLYENIGKSQSSSPSSQYRLSRHASDRERQQQRSRLQQVTQTHTNNTLLRTLIHCRISWPFFWRMQPFVPEIFAVVLNSEHMRILPRFFCFVACVCLVYCIHIFCKKMNLAKHWVHRILCSSWQLSKHDLLGKESAIFF